MKGNALTYAQLALGMVIYGSATPISKMITGVFPSMLASELRVLVAVVILLPFLLKDFKVFTGLKKGDWLRLFVIALFGMVGFGLTMLYGMKQLPGTIGSIVMATTPAVVATGSILFMGDHFNARKGWAIALAVLGVVILEMGDAGASTHGGLGADAGQLWLGIALIFAAVCCEAVYTLVGKRVSESLSPAHTALIASAMAVVMFLPMAWQEWSSFDSAAVSLSQWLAMLWWGGGTLALGTIVWYKGVSKVQGSMAAGFMGLMPLSGLVLSYILLGESFQWIHVPGMGLELLAIWLITGGGKKSDEPRDVSQDGASGKAQAHTG